MRGRLPVLISTASASTSVMPSAVSATTWCGPFMRPVPRRIRTPWLSSSWQTLRLRRPSMIPIRQAPTPWAARRVAGVGVEAPLDDPAPRGQPLCLDDRRPLVGPPPPEPGGERHPPAGRDHRLGRDAVPQMGGPAHDLALDQRDV